ncbi:hypothetical protein DYB25_008426, partial [Aphanomyces astaci]
VRAHAQSLQCSFVIGYNESCTIHDDVCVMSACGTAAVVKYPKKPRRPTAVFPPDATAAPLSAADALDASPQLSRSANRTVFHESPCMMCHIPYSRSLAPFSKYDRYG